MSSFSCFIFFKFMLSLGDAFFVHLVAALEKSCGLVAMKIATYG